MTSVQNEVTRKKHSRKKGEHENGEEHQMFYSTFYFKKAEVGRIKQKKKNLCRKMNKLNFILQDIL